ncbi:hypothetical protein [Nocardioides pelophilus]|uniref:hypothetical protein n=1 Tax=Nocardioides pelophilus TaxID=2172019 RepID=UPI001600C3F7|nr:hypothetical protein [Nocardioides pelophilus]
MLAFALVIALALAACSSGPAAEPERDVSPVEQEAEVSTGRGGEVVSEDGKLRVTVPGHAVEGEGTLAVAPAAAPDGASAWSIVLAGDAKLTGEATLRFSVPDLQGDEPAPLIRWASHAGGKYRTAKNVEFEDEDTVVVTTTHFSIWVVDWWNDVLDSAKRWLADRLDRALSQAGEGKHPQCEGEDSVRGLGYQISSDSGRRIYWCLGLTNGQPALKTVNARGYGITAEFTPGLGVTGTSRDDLEGMLANLFKSPPSRAVNKVELIGSGDWISFSVEGATETAVRFAPDPGAYLLSAFSFALDTVAFLMDKVGARGALNKVRQSLDGLSCLQAMSSMASTELTSPADTKKFFGDALSGAFSCAGEAVGEAGLGVINTVLVQPILWVISGLATAANGIVAAVETAFDSDGYQIRISPPQGVPAEFLGEWSVHGGGLTIHDDGTAESFGGTTCPDGLPYTAWCTQFMTFNVTPTADGIKLTVTRVWVESDGVEVGFAYPPQASTGSYYLMWLTDIDGLAETELHNDDSSEGISGGNSLGNPYLCRAGSNAGSTGRCGA